ncbi:hypothetical protein AXX17_AT1G23070 [Arabidopsis thaliana]|uniref:F-box domain-containing protein n=1 Tax=Arabidopsis thaliana TaxID=3702 RepID=A0A178WKN1_ARATH|nr:hypothetical protein AXX17_AT1G23070 [Arabidopsis thaliana]
MGFLWDIIPIDKYLSTVPETEGRQQRIETRICALPDDLLLQILHHVPTKEAVATSILSKRWRYVWTMLPKLEFKDEGSESVGWFIGKSLQLHKAPKLDCLIVELGPHCPIDVDVRKWIENAVNRDVEELDFTLLWSAAPTSFPKSLYTCDTLVCLTLSNQILVDVSSPASLPSLLDLSLHYVVYKDDGSLVRLLSSSPVLKRLSVHRHEDDNLKTFTVKVSSLESLYYDENWLKNEVEDKEIDEVEDNEVDEVVDNEVEVDEGDDLNGSLVIDSPALKKLHLSEVWDYCLIENMSFLDEAFISNVPYPDEKFLRSLSSVKHLFLLFSKSMDFECRSLSWNQPSSITGCLLSHLETFRWRGYGGREDAKKLLMTYILANSKCLKTVEISLLATCNLEETQKELESMPRISQSSQLLISTKMLWRALGDRNDEMSVEIEEHATRDENAERSYSKRSLCAPEVEQLKYFLFGYDEEIFDGASELETRKNRCSDLTQKLSEQILKTKEFKSLSNHLKELKDNAEAEWNRAREKADYKAPLTPQQESLRIIFIKEQYDTKLQELQYQLTMSKKHGEELLMKLQDAIDESEARKKAQSSQLKRTKELEDQILELEADRQSVIYDKRETTTAYDMMKAELDCSLLSLECWKEEKQNLEAILQQCTWESLKMSKELESRRELVQRCSSHKNIEMENDRLNMYDQMLELADNNTTAVSSGKP